MPTTDQIALRLEELNCALTEVHSQILDAIESLDAGDGAHEAAASAAAGITCADMALQLACLRLRRRRSGDEN